MKTKLYIIAILIIFLSKKENKDIIKIIISNGIMYDQHKCIIDKKYKLIIKNIRNYIDRKLNKRISNISKAINNSSLLIYNDNLIIKIETNTSKQINFQENIHQKLKIKIISDHPKIINVNNQGRIKALRPGRAKIRILDIDKEICQIKVLSICNDGFINKSLLKKSNIEKYSNLMIVSHPDDETLWGGANLYKEKYFVVCLTNGYNRERSNDFRKVMNFTNNSGIILNYPDTQDNIRDDWFLVKNGIIKDLSIILNFKYWKKIVTHGPEGTTGHYHHKKTCEYVTKIAQKFNIFNNLYYFEKFHLKNSIPPNLSRISDKELEYKIKEIALYKSVKKIIYKLWFHMLPYENFILASKWKNIT